MEAAAFNGDIQILVPDEGRMTADGRKLKGGFLGGRGVLPSELSECKEELCNSRIYKE